MKIGVFDSGIGGITVLKVLMQNLGHHEFFYFGDNANLPYGNKSTEQVLDLTFSGISKMKKMGLNGAVVACNTASSLALPAIRNYFDDFPLVGMVEPGVLAVREAILNGSRPSKSKTILVLATNATVQGGVYKTRLLETTGDLGGYKVIQLPCPVWVPAIEAGWVGKKIMSDIVKEHLLEVPSKKEIGFCLLGCTHFPLIRTEIEKTLKGTFIIDPSRAVSDQVESTFGKREHGNKSGGLHWYFSDPSGLARFAIDSIQKIDPKYTIERWR